MIWLVKRVDDQRVPSWLHCIQVLHGTDGSSHSLRRRRLEDLLLPRQEHVIVPPAAPAILHPTGCGRSCPYSTSSSFTTQVSPQEPWPAHFGEFFMLLTLGLHVALIADLFCPTFQDRFACQFQSTQMLPDMLVPSSAQTSNNCSFTKISIEIRHPPCFLLLFPHIGICQ